MKISAAQIDNFIANNLANLDAVLLYGPDQGLAAERRKNITIKTLGETPDDMMISKFNANDLQKEPSRLYDEVNAISLIPGKRLIIINDAGNNFSKVIKEALALKKTDHFLIIIAGELAPSSSLRKFFETEDNIAALPCYVDDTAGIARIIRESLKEFNPNYDIINYISHNISGDRMMIKSELEKIKLFYHGKSQINVADIEILLSHANNNDFQDLANAVAGKNPEITCKLIDELLSSGIPAMTLIRVVINYFQRILEVKNNMSANPNFHEAIKSLRPPVFFKQKDLLQQHINLWQVKELQQILLKLENLEKTSKSYGSINADILAKFFFLIISKRAA